MTDLFNQPRDIKPWQNMTEEERMESIRNHYREYPVRDLTKMVNHMSAELAFQRGEVARFTKSGKPLQPEATHMIEPWSIGLKLMQEVLNEKTLTQPNL